MHPNEVEALRARPAGLVLPETAAAVDTINAALVPLEAARAAVAAKIAARRQTQQLGVDCATCEAHDWRAFQAGPLREFHTARRTAALAALAECEAAVTGAAADIRAREHALAVALGRLLGDKQAGADLTALLVRLGGGLPASQDAANAATSWRAIAEHSRRTLAELPAPLAPTANPAEAAEQLRDLLNKED